MLYAIIEASGKQLWIEPGFFYDLNRIDANPGDSVFFERVLLVKNHEDVLIGNPCLSKVKVEATVLRHLRAKKILVYKMKPKKGTRLKQGHRQDLTRIMVNSIHINNQIITK